VGKQSFSSSSGRVSFFEQVHGYRSGHQLLEATKRLARTDQDVIDKLSDLSGPLSPGEVFSPYLSSYALPSGSFYVIALTFQDLEAPRAGCVRTRSLLLPRGSDAANLNLDAVWAQLLQTHPLLSDSAVLAVRREFGLEELSDAYVPILTEISEAVFLEPRVPIAIFTDSEATSIGVRLLSAVWPRLRSDFSICTFALAPRFVNGKPFDAVFAPREARSRFSTWEGRRIEGSASVRPRHRWTSKITSAVFFSAAPQSAMEELGLMDSSDPATESTLRLSLLWKELTEAASTSPLAVLGLMDVATALGPSDRRDSVLVDEIAKSLQAIERLEVDQGWTLIFALASKLVSNRLRWIVEPKLSSASASLTARSPVTAAKWVVEKASHPEESMVVSGVARALASCFSAPVGDVLVSAQPMTLLGILDCTGDLARAWVDVGSKRSQVEAVRKLSLALSTLPGQHRFKHWQPLAPMLEVDEDAELLHEFVSGASVAELLQVAGAIWSRPGLSSVAADKLICDAAVEKRAVPQVRDILVESRPSVADVRVLRRLVRLTVTDVKWLLFQPTLSEVCSGILAALISDASAKEVSKVFGDRAIAIAALDCLLAGDEASAALRVLHADSLPDKEFLDYAFALLQSVGARERDWLIVEILARTFGADGQPPERASACLDRLGVLRGFDFVISHALHRADSSSALNLLLVSLTGLPESSRAAVLEMVSPIAHAVVGRPLDLSYDGAVALANMIQLALDSGAPHSFEAASTVLPMALRDGDAKGAPLVLATFPAVHESLRNADDGFGFRKLFAIDDWDKCKSARRELVRAFMASNWPPELLLIVAARIREIPRIVRRIAKEPGGMQYLHVIELRAIGLPASIRKTFQAEVDAIRDRRAPIPDANT
jgi:hypothetical protein